MSHFLWHRRQFLALPVAYGLSTLLTSAQAQEQSQWPEIKIAMIEGFSGAFGHAGEGVYRNLLLGTDIINARGGIIINGIPHRLTIERFDSQGSVQGALSMLRAVADQRIKIVVQGNSSAIAAALINAINRHNERTPNERMVFLNYSAVETSLTNEQCSFWHFRFDAHVDMRLKALFEVLKNDMSITKVYLVGQDYSFGRYVVNKSREMLAQIRPDIEIVGETLHPTGQVKDFIPYATRIKASGAQAVVTGNWGNDLSLLVRAVRDVGLDANFYTFYANDLGSPAAMGDAGIGRALAVIEWHPNAKVWLGEHIGVQAQEASDAFYHEFRERFSQPHEDFVRYRIRVMMEMLAQAISTAGQVDAQAIALALEGQTFHSEFHHAVMRASDHQIQQPLYVTCMERAATPQAPYANENGSYGFRTVMRLSEEQIQTPSYCQMARPV